MADVVGVVIIVDDNGPVVAYNRSESRVVGRVLDRLRVSGAACPETMKDIFKTYGSAYERRVYRAYLKKQQQAKQNVSWRSSI